MGYEMNPVEKIIVYRVQDIDGRGPFKPGFSNIWVKYRADHDNLKPWFVEFGRVDRQILYGETSGSACKSIKQLRRWFTKPEYKILKKYGYKSVKIEVDRIIAESDKQCFVARTIPFYRSVKIVKLY